MYWGVTMKLAKKLKKTMGLMLISTMVLSAVPTMAADYDNHWAKEAIIKWNDYGVATGYEEGIFKPSQEVKRSELATFIVRVFGLESTKNAMKFTDVAASAWYAQDVAKVSAAGIMQGASGQFNPNGFATREEVAVTLVNAFHLTGSGEMNFKDQGQIAAWAKEAVATLASNDYAKGQADNRFAPKANITRAEVVQLLDNIVKELVHKPNTYTNNIAGNVVVNTKDAVLEGIKVNGNVYLAQGIGLGDATLKNTEVAGRVFVAGGGVNSIHFDNVVVTDGVVVDTEAPIRIVSKDSDLKVEAKAKQNIVLTGSFKEVVVPADVVLELKGANVEKITVKEADEAIAHITIDKSSVVKELNVQAATQIKGEGKITLLKVEANGVTTSIKPSQTEVKPGYEKPTDTSGGGGGTGGGGNNTGGGNNNGGGNGNGGGTETPVVDYITVQSVVLKDAQNHETLIPESVLSINKKAITIDLTSDQLVIPSTIQEVVVTFENLKEGDSITTVIDFPILNQRTLSDTVEKDGKVSYKVADLSQQLNNKKTALFNVLKKLGYEKQVEKLFNEVGLSLEEDYLQDGSIDTAQSINIIKKMAAYLKAHQNNQDLQEVNQVIENFLKQFDISMDSSSVSITGKVTVKVSSLKDTEYTITVNY